MHRFGSVLVITLMVSSCAILPAQSPAPTDIAASVHATAASHLAPFFKSGVTPAAKLIDPQATPAAVELYAYLVSNIGKKIISGQTDQDKFEYVKKVTGSYPLIRDFDMQPYSPQYPYSWSGTAINPNTHAAGYYTFGPDAGNKNTDNAIKWYLDNNKKPIIDFQWHWHSPLGGKIGTNTFAADNTSFDVSNAVVPGTKEWVATIRDIDAIALQLQKLSDANVPILWRPLHEASGGGFWWDAHGPAAYIALWNMIYERLVNVHHLHNLVWTWTGDDPDWYPGNDKVDILGIDAYPGNYNYDISRLEYDKIHSISKGKKLLAMTENGPIPDIDKSLIKGAPWTFFMAWFDVTVGNDDAHLIEVYKNPNVITLENR